MALQAAPTLPSGARDIESTKACPCCPTPGGKEGGQGSLEGGLLQPGNLAGVTGGWRLAGHEGATAAGV